MMTRSLKSAAPFPPYGTAVRSMNSSLVVLAPFTVSSWFLIRIGSTHLELRRKKFSFSKIAEFAGEYNICHVLWHGFLKRILIGNKWIFVQSKFQMDQSVVLMNLWTSLPRSAIHAGRRYREPCPNRNADAISYSPPVLDLATKGTLWYFHRGFWYPNAISPFIAFHPLLSKQTHQLSCLATMWYQVEWQESWRDSLLLRQTLS